MDQEIYTRQEEDNTIASITIVAASYVIEKYSEERTEEPQAPSMEMAASTRRETINVVPGMIDKIHTWRL